MVAAARCGQDIAICDISIREAHTSHRLMMHEIQRLLVLVAEAFSPEERPLHLAFSRYILSLSSSACLDLRFGSFGCFSRHAWVEEWSRNDPEAYTFAMI